MTNADKIKELPSDKMAEFLRHYWANPCEKCIYDNNCYGGTEEDFCVLGTEMWLQQECKKEI